MMPDADGKPQPPPRARGGAGAGAGWAEEARRCGAEALGAALLVLLSGLPGAAPGAAGAVVAMLVQCLDHVSGAMFNPAVAAAALLWGRLRARRAAAYCAAQLAGAAAGAAALAALLGPAAAVRALTAPGAGAGAPAAAALEAAGGACLALANCASWDPRNQHLRDSWPLRIGATVAALSLVMSELTGASFNPARSLGPALVAAACPAPAALAARGLASPWEHHWVYWVGPLGGAAAGTVLYLAAWRPRAAPRLPR